MTAINKLREQIDACRAGSDDLALPGLAELAEAATEDRAVADELAQSQQFDRVVTAALHDVEIPAGLAERLLAAAEEPVARGTESLHVQSRIKHWSARRRWLLASGSVALTALVAVSASLWFRQPRLVTASELAGAVMAWQGQPADDAWQTASSLPRDLALDPAIAGGPLRWQKVRAGGSHDWSGIVGVVELSPPGGPRAVVYVVRSSARFAVPPMPEPSFPLNLSGRQRATAWQRPGTSLLFVLVVDEEQGHRLENYLHRRPHA
jgi:hypothetical protein